MKKVTFLFFLFLSLNVFAAVSVSFTQQATSLSEGEEGTWEVTVQNPDSSDVVTDIVVTVPDDFTVTDTGGGTLNSGPPQTITWSSVTVPAGGSYSVSYKARPNCGCSNGEVMQADAGGSTAYSSQIEVKYSFLVVGISPETQDAYVGDTVSWTITIENTGTGDIVNGVNVTDTLGSGFTFQSITGPNAPSDVSNPWNTGPIAAGDSVQYTLTATVTGCDPDTLTNVVLGEFTDGTNICQSKSVTAGVKILVRKPDVSINVGGATTLSYCDPTQNQVTITIDNTNGEGPAKNFKLQMTGLVSDWQVSNVSGATFDSNTDTFTVGDIAAGDSVSFSFYLGPDGTQCGSNITMSDSILYKPDYEDECGNQYTPPYAGPVTYTVDQGTRPHFEVSKSGPRYADRGETGLQYTLTVKFVAPSDYGSVTIDITDDYPDSAQTGLTDGFVVTDPAGGSDDGDKIVWSDVTFNPGDTWTKTITMTAPTDKCAPGHDYTNILSISAVNLTDCLGCPYTVTGEASQNTYINQPDDPAISDSSKTVTYIDSPTGVDAAQVCTNIQYTTCYTFSSNTSPSNWQGIIFSDDMPHQSYVSVDSVKVNGTEYSNYTVTNTSPLQIDLSGLDSEGAPAPNTGATLCLTFTLHADEPACGFIDFSGLYIPSQSSGCSDDDDYDQGVIVNISENNLALDLSNSPKIVDTCDIQQYRIDLVGGGGCSGDVWDLYDLILNVNTNNHYTLVLGDSNYPVEFHNVVDTLGNTINSFDPTDNGDGTYTWNLGDIKHNVNGNTPYITFYMKRDCDATPGTEGWSASAQYNNRCDNDSGSRNKSASANANIYLLNKANLVLKMSAAKYTTYTPYPEFIVQIINSGAGKANDTEYKIDFGSGLTYWDYSVDTGQTPVVTGNQGDSTVTFHWDTLSPNEEVRIKVRAHVVGCDNLTLDGTLTWCDTVCQTVTAHSEVLLPLSDLAITQHTGEPIDSCGYKQSSFTILAKNTGDTDVFNVHVLEELPDGIGYVANSASYTITSSYGNSSGSLEPTVNGQTLDWDFSSLLGTNPDGDKALEPGGTIEITFSVEMIDCTNFQNSTKQARASAEYDKLCQASSGTPDSLSPLFIITVNPTNPHVRVVKEARNITKGTDWVTGEVDADSGDTVEWRITYTSDGDYVAINTVISDTLPSNVTLVSGSFSSTCSTCNETDYFGSGCSIGDMNIGDSCTVTYQTTVDTCTSSPTTNTAKAEYGCDCYRVSNTDSVDLRTTPELPNNQVEVTHSGFTTCGGQITITITNNGGTAYNDGITETLPPGYVYDSSGGCNISFSNTPPGVTHGSGIPNCTGLTDGASTLTWDSTNVDFIAPGETLTITFYVKTDGTYCDTTSSNDSNNPDVSIPNLTNSVSFDYHDSCSNNYSSSGSDTINPTQPDIDISITPDKQIVAEGGTANWTITLTNNGDAPAYNITLTDTLGDGFSNITDDQSGTWSGNTGTWTISGPIAPGDTWVVHVSATVNSGSLLNHAVVEGMCKDQGGSDTCSYTHDEADAYTAGFELTKTVDKATANIGEELTYNIVARFLNTDTFKSVTITDTLPPNTDYVSATQNGGDFPLALTINGQVLTFNLGDFQGLKEFNYNIKVRIKNVSDNASGTILTNNVQADFGIDFDGDDNADASFSQNDSAQTTLTEPNLSITKSINPHTNLQSGDSVTVTLNVTNNGDGPAYRISVTDLLNDTNGDGFVDANDTVVYDCSTIAEGTTPAGYTFSVNGSSPACEVTYTSDGPINPGDTVTFTFTVKISQDAITGSTYTNTARVSGWSLASSDSESGNTSYDRETNGAGSYNISLSRGSVQSKNLISTSEDSTDSGDANINSNPPVAVGEVVEVEITYSIPQGVTNNVRLYDRLQNAISNISWGTYVPGSAELARTSTALSCTDNPGDINNAPVNTFVNVDSNISTNSNSNYYFIYLDLGDVTNSDNDSNTSERYIFRLKVVVNNNTSTNAGTLLYDQGRLRYQDADGSNHYVRTSNVVMHVAEPTPTITKTANPSVASGGDTITFTLQICNTASGSNAASAFDWVINDPLPSEYENPQVTNVDTGSTGANVSASFTGNTLNASIDQLDPGECITITYTAQLKSDVQYGQVVTNTATFQTTSLPGDHGTGNATPGNPGEETGERTGSGNGVNDLYGQSSAIVTINRPSLAKDIVNYKSYYAIEEKPQFRITISVPEGSSNNFVVTDQLPSGLTFVSGSLNVTLSSGITSSNSPDESNANFFSYDTNNNVLTFDFGTLTAQNAGDITIDYTVNVDNVLSNQDGVILQNTATLTFDDPNNAGNTITVGPVNNAHSVRVGEPNLEISKTITQGAVGSEAGDTVSWQIDIANNGHTTAYQVDWRDVLPDGLYNISNAHVSVSGGNVYLNGTTTTVSDSNLQITTTNNNNDTISIEPVEIAPDATLTITFDSVLMDSVVFGETLTNETSANYTSLVNGGRDNSTNPGSVDDDDDSDLNNYEESANQSLTVASDIAIDKRVDKTQVTIGDTVIYTIKVDVIEGVTPNVSVHDILPSGLTYVNHSISQGHIGMNFTNANYNTRLGTGQEVYFDFGDVENPANNSSTDDYFEIEIVARVDNVDANQDGVVLKNGEQLEGSEVYVEYGEDTNNLSRLDYDYDATQSGIQGIPVTIVEPELTITKTADNTEPPLGSIITFTITVSHTSNSHSDAYDVEVTDVLPNGLTFVDCSLPSGSYSVNGQNLTFTKSSLTIGAPDNGQWQFTYRAKLNGDVAVNTVLTNDATVTYKSITGATGASDSGRTGDDCGNANALNDYCANTNESVTATAYTFIDAQKTVDLVNDADGDGTYTPGDTIEYTVTLKNNDGDLTGVQFVDDLPSEITYVAGSLTTTQGSVDDSGAPHLVVNVGDMASNATVTLTFRATINQGVANGTTISNQGYVESDQTVREYTDEDGIDSNGDQPTDVVIGGQDKEYSLYVWKFVELLSDNDSSDSITAGDTMRYYFVFYNEGNKPLTGVTLSDVIPTGLTPVGGSEYVSSGNISLSGNNISVSGMSIAVDDYEYASVDVTINNPLYDSDGDPSTETFVNQGTADSNETDSVLTDGNGDSTDGYQPTSFTATDGSPAQPNIDVEKRWSLLVDNDSDGIVDPGDTIRYTIYVYNNGAVDAENVRLSDNIPSNTTLVSGSVTTSHGVVVTENPVDVNIGTVSASSVEIVTFDVVIDSNVADGTVIQNQASVSGDNFNTEQSDDNGNDDDGINPTLTPVSTGTSGGNYPYNFEKTLYGTSLADTSGLNVAIGEVATFRMSFNLPSGTVNEVAIVDTLPQGLNYVAGSARLARIFDTGLTSSMNPGDINNAPSGSFVSLTDGNDIEINGSQIRLFFGDITNSDNDGNAEQYILEIQAIVDNVMSNQQGTVLTNRAVLTYKDALGQPQLLPEQRVSLNVVEPDIVVNKEAISGGVGSTHGDTVRFRITVSNLSGSAYAYNVNLSDVIPHEFLGAPDGSGSGATKITNIALSTSGGVVVTSTGQPVTNSDVVILSTVENGDTITLNPLTLPPNSSFTIDFDTVVHNDADLGSYVTNTANVDYTSLPTGGRDGSDGEGGLNDYVASYSLSIQLCADLYITSTAENGTIQPSSIRCCDPAGTYTVYFEPDDGYHLAGVYIDGKPSCFCPKMRSFTFEGVSTDHTVHIVFVRDENPVINSFTATPLSGIAPLKVDFSVEAYDPDGANCRDIKEYRWDFNNDGVIDLTTIEPNASHVYALEGVYTAVVYAVDEENAITESFPITIKVTRQNPVGLNGALLGSQSTISGFDIWAVNNNPSAASVTISLVDIKGKALGEKTIEIPPFGKRKLKYDGDLNEASRLVVNANQKLTYYVDKKADKVESTSYLGSITGERLIIPHAAEEKEYWDSKAYIATADNDILKLTLSDESVVTDKDYLHIVDLNNLIKENQDVSTCWGLVEFGDTSPFSTLKPLSGFISFKKKNCDGAFVEMPSKGYSSCILPHIPVEKDLFWTGYVIDNLEYSNQNITFTFYNADGNVVGTKTISVNARSKVKGLFRDDFADVYGNASWAKVEGEGKFVCAEIFGVFPQKNTKIEGGAICGMLVSSDTVIEGILPVVNSDDGHWTGIAIANPNAEQTTVKIRLIDKDGNVTGEKSVDIKGYGQYKVVVDDLFNNQIPAGGYIYLISDKPVSACEIEGDYSYTVMKALTISR
ncbi:hypothetical protein TTHT_2101 [Thermotomaculum hydrothermale]|uniref:PKD domain-containing protein n=1 Tax=Thermotomaculum hydrothermale TaxID=981385 RepID=A0A7R6Q0V9_9BACT|nr:isopeptide-forming domain-containing fimbrial protein [Thermotomaculum hydrothermale]BBB33538.1 hypothetical protein TTHT_2101 [Thermotomaculum hydrothermale]